MSLRGDNKLAKNKIIGGTADRRKNGGLAEKWRNGGQTADWRNGGTAEYAENPPTYIKY